MRLCDCADTCKRAWRFGYYIAPDLCPIRGNIQVDQPENSEEAETDTLEVRTELD